jgi:hypothetical protein
MAPVVETTTATARTAEVHLEAPSTLASASSPGDSSRSLVQKAIGHAASIKLSECQSTSDIANAIISNCPSPAARGTLDAYRKALAKDGSTEPDKTFVDTVGSHLISYNNEFVWNEKSAKQRPTPSADAFKLVHGLLLAGIIPDQYSYRNPLEPDRPIIGRALDKLQRHANDKANRALKIHEEGVRQKKQEALELLVRQHPERADDIRKNWDHAVSSPFTRPADRAVFAEALKMTEPKKSVVQSVSTYQDATQATPAQLQEQVKYGPEQVVKAAMENAQNRGIPLSSSDGTKTPLSEQTINQSAELTIAAKEVYGICKREDGVNRAAIMLVEMKINNPEKFEALRNLGREKYSDLKTSAEQKQILKKMGDAFKIADKSFEQAKILVDQKDDKRQLTAECRQLAASEYTNLGAIEKALSLAVNKSESRKPALEAFKIAVLEKAVIDSSPEGLNAAAKNLFEAKRGVEHVASFLYSIQKAGNDGQVDRFIEEITPNTRTQLYHLMDAKIEELESKTGASPSQLPSLLALRDKLHQEKTQTLAEEAASAVSKSAVKDSKLPKTLAA